MGDVHSEVDGNAVIIDNSKDYAIYVHDGTRKMAGRPYIRDGIETGRERTMTIGSILYSPNTFEGFSSM